MKLRRLTKKSIVGFGKNADMTVQQLFDTFQHSYIRWMYYCNSHINFMDDILLEVGISEDMKIDKPGKDVDYFRELGEAKAFGKNLETEDGSKSMARKFKARISSKSRKFSNRLDCNVSSMGHLMKKNHGK